jgi:hypothetical protein
LRGARLNTVKKAKGFFYVPPPPPPTPKKVIIANHISSLFVFLLSVRQVEALPILSIRGMNS